MAADRKNHSPLGRGNSLAKQQQIRQKYRNIKDELQNSMMITSKFPSVLTRNDKGIHKNSSANLKKIFNNEGLVKNTTKAMEEIEKINELGESLTDNQPTQQVFTEETFSKMNEARSHNSRNRSQTKNTDMGHADTLNHSQIEDINEIEAKRKDLEQ